MPPELLGLSQDVADYSSDYYSLGVVFTRCYQDHYRFKLPIMPNGLRFTLTKARKVGQTKSQRAAGIIRHSNEIAFQSRL